MSTQESKKIKTLFSTESKEYDSKHILNLLPGQEISQKTLDRIESGITSEQLFELKESLKICVYRTQITIHGIFPQVSRNYFAGYMNLFQNKNKSIGVRYSAIDSMKFTEICSSEKFKLSEFFSYKSSKCRGFSLGRQVNKLNYTLTFEKLKRYMKRFESVNYNGGAEINLYNCFGSYIMKLEIDFNAILKVDIQSFIDCFLTDSELKDRKKASEIIEKIENEKSEIRRIEQEKIDLELKQKREMLKEKNQIFLDWLNKNFPKSKIETDKIYIRYFYDKIYIDYDFTGEYRFKWEVFKFSKTGRKFKKVFAEFEQLKSALEYAKAGNFDNSKNCIYKGYNKENEFNLIQFSTTQESKNNIETKATYKIVNYNDKSVAIFGDTIKIKDKLKALGMRFNRFLKHENKTVPGWVGSVSLRFEIEKIIN